uniref:Dual specificity protein phosphatase 23 n=1 Tax=Petromyzon marinus TaxID=7757 RepID=A0AAJ7WZB7_PETMA|nr:dual specificity protein phosphatase 23 [Petromyzon marinus]XP_032815332.1 dual specificity protein phosphatase 23 [Petromyzon marinus]XP_032815333.1 dual specificity protein phosphatase 23 [Petromyzon marinus]XP_032815334.1 dual specificity protein phosphatase 23 [Petromyzon marinus]
MASGGSAPPNFSWVEPGRLAGLAMPHDASHYRYLYECGVRHLVSLTHGAPRHADTCPGIRLHAIKIEDFHPPLPEQIERFLDIVSDAGAKGEAVAVHCMHGHGRTGTMLACFLVRHRALSGVDAVAEIRRLRPGSIETREQEIAVTRFYQRHK